VAAARTRSLPPESEPLLRAFLPPESDEEAVTLFQDIELAGALAKIEWSSDPAERFRRQSIDRDRIIHTLGD
jgi:hypothetical protein